MNKMAKVIFRFEDSSIPAKEVTGMVGDFLLDLAEDNGSISIAIAEECVPAVPAIFMLKKAMIYFVKLVIERKTLSTELFAQDLSLVFHVNVRSSSSMKIH